eukprot:gene15459-20857_t
MMDYILRKLPEHILGQLFCEWLLITDISVLDCALCCHNINQRHLLLRIISESSARYPLYSHRFIISPSYWSWLVNRRFCVKQLYFGNDQLFSFDLFWNYFNQSENDNGWISSNLNKQQLDLNMNYKLLNFIENITFDSVYNNRFLELSNWKMFFRLCTNLRSLSLERLKINDDSLSSILETSSHYLTQLILIKCDDIIGTNEVLSSSLTNIKELKIVDCVNLKADGWNIMLMGLTNLISLTIHYLSVTMLRSMSNLFLLRSLTFQLINDFNVNNSLSGIIFPEYLSHLSVSFTRYTQLNELDLQNFFANELRNVTYLELIRDGYIQNFNSAPSLPEKLTTLDISKFSINFSMAEVVANLIFPSSLTELDMSHLNDDIDEDCIKAMLSNNNLPNLTRLDINGNTNIDRSIFSEEFLHLTLLTAIIE